MWSQISKSCKENSKHVFRTQSLKVFSTKVKKNRAFSNQNLIFLKWNWSVELSCSTSRVGERTGIYPLKILPPSCLLEERFKSNQFKQFWQYWLWDMFLVLKKWCVGGGAMSLDNILVGRWKRDNSAMLDNYLCG